MNILKTILVILGLILTATAFRTSEPEPYFSSPISHTKRLSGTFGELRWNHFHTGIDFKSSNGLAGDPIYAVQDGFVSRIKVEEDGYGRALYIDHPNGFTSVYAHLHTFSNDIEQWVRERQHQMESFAINAYLNDSLLLIKKGQRIGTMGNAGSSSGVHLHFELRDTKSEIPCNPLLLGYNVKDNRPPEALRLKWSSMDSLFHTLDSDVLRLKSVGNDTYTIYHNTLEVPAGRIGLAVQCHDRLDGAWNRNGLYGMKMFRDSMLSYSFQMRCIPFSHLRYLNAHIDYEERYHNRRYYHRLFQLPGNKLGIYESQTDEGFIELKPGERSQIEIELYDVAGNTSTLRFSIKAGPYQQSLVSEKTHLIRPNEAYEYKDSLISIHLPRNSVYRPTPWSYQWEETEDFPKFHFLREDIPLHQSAIISISLDSFDTARRNKIHLERLTRGRWEYAGGTLYGATLRAKLDQAGTYRLRADGQPPEITPIAMSRNLRGWNRIKFRIDDPDGAHPLQFEGCIDGEWILMEYDEKSRMLTHRLNDTLSGEHYFELTVWDDRMNESHYSLSFER